MIILVQSITLHTIRAKYYFICIRKYIYDFCGKFKTFGWGENMYFEIISCDFILFD